MQFCEYLKSLGACESAIAWVGEKTREYAIAECEELEWLLWLLAHEDRNALITLTKEFVSRAKSAEGAWASYDNEAWKDYAAASDTWSSDDAAFAASVVASWATASVGAGMVSEIKWQLSRTRELLKKTNRR